ncbi:hypothetical protein FISHEDRAFT_53855, partial [Fistulina hepatica ATCC 64428]
STWDEDEASARNYLFQKIPDSTVLRVARMATVAEAWKYIVTEFSAKGQALETELRTQFTETKCGAKTNVRTFLEDLVTRRENLARSGVSISNKEMRDTILKSLPRYLSSFVSNQLTAVHLIDPTKSVDPNNLASMIAQEWEHQEAQRKRSGGGDT